MWRSWQKHAGEQNRACTSNVSWSSVWMPRFRALTDVDSAPLWSVSSLSAWLSLAICCLVPSYSHCPLSKPIFYLLWLLVLRHTRSCIDCIPWDCWICFPSLVIISLINFGKGPSLLSWKSVWAVTRPTQDCLHLSEFSGREVVWFGERTSHPRSIVRQLHTFTEFLPTKQDAHYSAKAHDVSFVKSIISPMPRLPQTFEWTQYACAYTLFAIPI